MSDAKVNFVKQQGFDETGAATCSARYPALMFQPRVIGALVVAGVVAQAPMVFLILSAVLWWSALLPALNPFEKLYNSYAVRSGRSALTTAPAPRRFSQGMAATFMLLIGMSLLAGWRVLAWTCEALLLAALGALIFGAFCAGSYVFHLLTGNAGFAKSTLPWGRGA